MCDPVEEFDTEPSTQSALARERSWLDASVMWLESRTTSIGIGTLPGLWRLALVLSWGGARRVRRSVSTEVESAELKGDGGSDIEIASSSSWCSCCCLG